VSTPVPLRKNLPLLDLVEAGEKGDRDEDDDCFLAVAYFELYSVKISELSILEVLGSGLEI